MRQAWRYTPIILLLLAAIVVGAALGSTGYARGLILVFTLVAASAQRVLWRRSRRREAAPVDSDHSSAAAYDAERVEHLYAGRKHLDERTEIPFRRGWMVATGIGGAAFGGLMLWVASFGFSYHSFRSWLGDLIGIVLVIASWMFFAWVPYAVRGYRGRPAIILDHDGLTLASPHRTERIPWSEIESIHWQWPPLLTATRPYVSIERRKTTSPVTEPKRMSQLLRTAMNPRGFDPAKLAIPTDELAHLIRTYSSGRLGIGER